jgi:hypothetical protein
MPKVHSAKAARDYPEHDIKKGDTYFHWSFFRGPKMMSKTQPKRSQTTGSAKLSNVYAAEESLQALLDIATCPSDVIDALDQAITDAESCIDEYNEAIDNLNDGFPNGCPQIDETEEARDNIEAWKDELESAKSEVEGLDATDYVDEDYKPEADKPRDKVEGWDDLNDDEQEQMLSAAQDFANGISLEL